MAQNIQRKTAHVLRDLHARESMRLAWYRQVTRREEFLRTLRERKANHQAFLLDLLRRRGLKPAWYAGFFRWIGGIFGWWTALLPRRTSNWVERTLERWLFLRYERYLEELRLKFNLRTMIEALELKRLPHNEPGPDVLSALEAFHAEQQQLAQQAQAPRV